MQSASVPPEVETVESLVRVAGVVALIIGILNLLLFGIVFVPAMGLFMMLGPVGLILGILSMWSFILMILFIIVDIWLYTRCRWIRKLIGMKELREAKRKTLIPIVLGFIFAWIIVGVLLLAAYIKFDDAIRAVETAAHTS